MFIYLNLIFHHNAACANLNVRSRVRVKSIKGLMSWNFSSSYHPFLSEIITINNYYKQKNYHKLLQVHFDHKFNLIALVITE